MIRSNRSVLDLKRRGYRLATAQILYHMPDHPGVLQTFVWQHYDLVPDYPELRRFLAFWQENLDGKLHSVEVCHTGLLESRNVTLADSLFQMH